MQTEPQARPRWVRIVPVVCLVLALSIALVWLSSPAYFLMEYLDPGSAIWHDDEAFFFIGQSTSAKIARRYQVLLEAVGLYWSPPERLHNDLVVIYVRGGTLEQYCLRDFGSGGGAFPFEGRLYYMRGGQANDWPYIWEWTGTNFARLAKAAALELINRFPPENQLPHSVTAQIKKQGWREESSLAMYATGEWRYNIALASHSLTLITARAGTARHPETVVLQGRSRPGFSETLLACPNSDFSPVSRKKYTQLKNRESSSAGANHAPLRPEDRGQDGR